MVKYVRMKHKTSGRHWAEARKEKLDKIDIMVPTAALLAVLKIINSEGGAAAKTDSLKDIVFLAARHSQHRREWDCRLFRSLRFPDNHPEYSSDWLQGLSERMAYIQQMGYAVHAAGSWRLTPEGEQALKNSMEENGVMPIQPAEIEAVLAISGSGLPI